VLTAAAHLTINAIHGTSLRALTNAQLHMKRLGHTGYDEKIVERIGVLQRKTQAIEAALEELIQVDTTIYITYMLSQ
jgi:hypothetical protein